MNKLFLLLCISLFFVSSCGSPTDLSHTIIVNPRKGTLNGIPLGDKWNKKGFSKQFKVFYPEQAFTEGESAEINWTNGLIDGYILYWNDPKYPYRKEFKGSLEINNEKYIFNKGTKKENIINLLGEPFWTDKSNGLTLLFYEFQGLEWQIEFSPNETLNYWILTNDPLLSDQEQREAYNVNIPYPFDKIK